MKRILTLAAVGTAIFGIASGALPASASAAEPRDPQAPGCNTTTMVADHTSGTVQWEIECDAPRWVSIDATAFAGTPDDHVIVDTQQAYRFVEAGAIWTGSLRFDTEGVDQLRAQAVTFVEEHDPTERPAIIGGATG
ncbi:hypothetical protein GCM10017714_21480 [Curtobacterium pusillum]|uniref:Uncharacterized protein n=1 Tax=Curtobacterium pusillum TaxID=69373 RepID=A0ABX2MFM6_9MICO|nr:hypothetical protein [Curtobacterium pusillum]NUU14557.1 hypothetical protein [Curtobacterium pusillum]GLK32010.1 hypothetical protein GCM10017610_22950 [Curtobacterium pusillum]